VVPEISLTCIGCRLSFTSDTPDGGDVVFVDAGSICQECRTLIVDQEREIYTKKLADAPEGEPYSPDTVFVEVSAEREEKESAFLHVAREADNYDDINKVTFIWSADACTAILEDYNLQWITLLSCGIGDDKVNTMNLGDLDAIGEIAEKLSRSFMVGMIAERYKKKNASS